LGTDAVVYPPGKIELISYTH